jgi:NADH:ubiquinone oxidoreductase subunit 6 (subunit J)
MIVFAMLSGLILGSAVAAMLLRRLVHAVLCLSVTFAGLAAVFLALGAQFVGFAQILVYIGAVAILIVFTLLLTQNGDVNLQAPIASSSWLVGATVAGLVFGCLVICIVFSAVPGTPPPLPDATVKQIGQRLMADQGVALEALGLLLTAAIIGATIIAMPPKKAA